MSDVIISGSNGGKITAQVTEVTITAQAVSNAILATVNEAGIEVTCQTAGSVAVIASLGALVTVTVAPQSEIFVTVGDVETDPVFSASEAAKFAVGDALKLSGIEAGAQKNVAETDPVFSSWNKSYNDLIDKPTIPPAQIQSDWNQTNSLLLDYIKNKPTIPAAGITALTGDVTATGPGSVPATIATGAVTLAKMANLAANSIIGNNTSSPAAPAALTIAQVLALGGLATSITGGPLTLAANGAYTLTVAGTSTVNGSLVGNISGGGTVSTGGFVGTLPATGTFALLQAANVFTANNRFENVGFGRAAGTVTQIGATFLPTNPAVNNVLFDAIFELTPSATSISTSQRLLNFLMRVSGSGGSSAEVSGAFIDTYNNQTSGTLSSMFGIRVFNRIQNAGLTANLRGYSAGLITTASGSGNVTDYTAFLVESPTISGAALISDALGLQIRNLGNAKISFAAGIYINSQTGATANWGIYSVANAHFFSGPASGITVILRDNATTPGDTLQLQNSSAGVNHSLGLAGVVFNEQGLAGCDVRFESDTEANMLFLDANGDTDGALYLGGSTNGIKINKGGDLTLLGMATVWKDIDFPLIAKTTGVNTPTYNTLQGNLTMLQWAVNDALQCDVEEFIHEWKEGSAATWHVHVITGGTNVDNRYIRFEVEYTWANFGATIPANATITSADMLIPAGTAALTHFIFDIGSFTPTGGKIGAHVKARLKRVAATGTAPTANPFAELIQLHVECDSMGSKTISAK